ncbi:MAG: FecR family protein [Mucilaginibacter sp.]|nr:FecR family protein [Mucilaginibacter sp.]
MSWMKKKSLYYCNQLYFMTKEDFIALYEKCLSGECTTEDLHLLERYQDDFELTDRPWITEMGNKQEIKAKIYNKLQSQMDAPKHYLFKPYQFAIAASLLVFLSAGIIFFISPTKKQASNQLAKVKAVIVPGSNKAILTLADGTNINLGNSKKGILSKQGAASVNKLSNGELSYNLDAGNKSENFVSYNLISTPRGGQYQVILSDGTKVWLNAASSLKYPAVFAGKERDVELTGEAYFEVAKNKDMPFKVTVNGMEVKVLGTHFNIMAYNDEKATETTLLEGSVKLIKNTKETLLIPGQQGALINGQPDFNVHKVNVDDIIAWKNGFFSFENESIQSIMREISRWYDVDIEYSGNLIKQNYGGTVSRFKDIDELLKTLELTGTIHFKTEGRRVTVMP